MPFDKPERNQFRLDELPAVRWVLQMAGSVMVEAPKELTETVVKYGRELFSSNS